MYSKDDLMELRTAALSQKWPSYLDEAFKNNRGTWDPDRWHQNKKRGSTPPPSDDRNSEKGSKKDENNEAGVNKVRIPKFDKITIRYVSTLKLFNPFSTNGRTFWSTPVFGLQISPQNNFSH